MEEGKVTETQKNDLRSTMFYGRDEYFTDELVKDSAFTFLRQATKQRQLDYQAF